ncbi:MAG TPA: DUF417 family protein [Thermodesulfobacteriota bacterium]|nr:DUF417 family protein [Thermodesulfobacteriota bacterium]
MITETLNISNGSEKIQALGRFLLRYGLVLIVAWIGAMKFTAYEAAAIQPLVETSSLMSWMYKFLSIQGVSNLLGITEITIAVMIALRSLSAKLCALGSLLAVGMFLTTLTFLFTLPGWEPSLGGFPALSGSGGFLIKDLLLLGAAVWSLGEALGGIGE